MPERQNITNPGAITIAVRRALADVADEAVAGGEAVYVLHRLLFEGSHFAQAYTESELRRGWHQIVRDVPGGVFYSVARMDDGALVLSLVSRERLAKKLEISPPAQETRGSEVFPGGNVSHEMRVLEL